MTKNEFIDKWCAYWQDREGMEFDLVSVINQTKNNELEKMIEEKYKKIEEEREEQIKAERKAYRITAEEAKKYIKNITFSGGIRRA